MFFLSNPVRAKRASATLIARPFDDNPPRRKAVRALTASALCVALASCVTLEQRPEIVAATTAAPAPDAGATKVAEKTAQTTKPSKPEPSAARPSSVAQGASDGTRAPGGATPTSSGTPPSTPPSPPLRPFNDIVKDAKEQKGLFTLWSKDEKVWIELAPEQLDRLYFFQINMSRGLAGELPAAFSNRGRQVITFKRVGNTVQMIAKNFSQRATPNTPLAIATQEGTSDSLLMALPVLTQPHPERKSFLVEANAIFMSDISMLSNVIDVAFRSGYSLDRANSSFRKLTTDDSITTFDVDAHFMTQRIPTPAPSMGPMPSIMPTPVRSAPDPRSFFLGLHYSLRKLPEEPMRRRNADQRIGHFNQLQWDFSDNQSPFARKYVVNRWRLEKKDPSAALSEPKQAIVFWLDKNIPLEYRDTVKAGVLEWNKAFERIGFKDALRVDQQPDDAEWNTNDATRASIRWFVDQSDGAMAVGPSTTDPRSGEILDADVTIGHGWVALPRRRLGEQGLKPTVASLVQQRLFAAAGSDSAIANDTMSALQKTFLPSHYLPTVAAAVAATSERMPQDIRIHAGPWQQGAFGDADAACSYAESALAEASFALDLIHLRAIETGNTVDTAALDRAVHAILKDVVTHEIGHALGLRHNFRASTIYTQAQINDPAFTRENGISGSVMDYNAFNIALNGERQGELAMSTIGPYDFWAIEYAYKEIAPDAEVGELAKIAARSSDPKLAYATDPELFSDFDGMDPEVNLRDVGGDPLEFAKRRIQLSRELFDRLQTQKLADGASYDVLTRNVMSGMNELARAFQMASKYVGGVVYARDGAGSPRAAFTPVSADVQRSALKLIVDNLFAQTGFDFKPEFVSRLSDNMLDSRGPPVDRSLDTTLWALQAVTLDRLMSSRVAERIDGAKSKLAGTVNAFTVDELHRSLVDAIWKDVRSELPPARRALQREHARRIAAGITRPVLVTTTAGDVRALHRTHARQLLARIKQAQINPRLNTLTRAHLEEVSDTLENALRAQVTKSVG